MKNASGSSKSQMLPSLLLLSALSSNYFRFHKKLNRFHIPDLSKKFYFEKSCYFYVVQEVLKDSKTDKNDSRYQRK